MKLRSFFKDDLFHNIIALFSVQGVRYLLPLITIPYLTRVLGPSSWGLLALSQAFGFYIILLVEYGFIFSASREVSQNRSDPDKLGEILAGVLGAKFALSAFAIITAFLAQFFVPIFINSNPIILWSSVGWSLAQAFNLMWYFQGQEKMRLAASIEIFSKVLATFGVFIFIHNSTDIWKFFILQALASIITFIISFFFIHRTIPIKTPSITTTITYLKVGWSIFVFRSAESLYQVGNSFLLGLFSLPITVGYYAGAEKITKSIFSLMDPVYQALYPRLSHLAQHSKTKAANLAKFSFLSMGSVSILLSTLLYLFAPFIVHILLGKDFGPAIRIVRVLSIIIPLIAVKNTLGLQWMLPLRLDKTFNKIIIISGIINLILVLILVPRYQAIGMAWVLVITEFSVIFFSAISLRLKKMDPFSIIKAAKNDASIVKEIK